MKLKKKNKRKHQLKALVPLLVHFRDRTGALLHNLRFNPSIQKARALP